MGLPVDPKARKALPITTGVLDYFPRALAEVARVSVAGNEQHNPGQPLHWAREKSTDHADCITRHLIDRGKFDSDGQRHSAKVAWRALALLDEELRAEEEAKPIDDRKAAIDDAHACPGRQMCQVASPGLRWICNRTKGHTGRHVAVAGDKFLEEWYS